MQEIYAQQRQQLKAEHAKTLTLLHTLAQQTQTESAAFAKGKEKLSRIEAALARLQDSIYGLCLSCSEPIAWERLHALPYAELCLTCQLTHES